MKRSLLVLVSLLAIVAMLFTTAAATPPSVKFVSSHFTIGKGVVFVFEVKGLEHKELTGWVNYSGRQFSLDCNEGDGNKVFCVASDGISQFAGKSVQGVLGGFGFSASVPARRAPRQFCYSVYDYSPTDITLWAAFATHCQDNQAEANDMILLQNPDFGTTFWEYFYQPDLSVCPISLPFGNGYAFGCEVAQ